MTSKNKYIVSRNLTLEIQDDFESIFLNEVDKTKEIAGEGAASAKQKVIEFFHTKAAEILANALMAENILVLAGAGASIHCSKVPLLHWR